MLLLQTLLLGLCAEAVIATLPPKLITENGTLVLSGGDVTIRTEDGSVSASELVNVRADVTAAGAAAATRATSVDEALAARAAAVDEALAALRNNLTVTSDAVATDGRNIGILNGMIGETQSTIVVTNLAVRALETACTGYQYRRGSACTPLTNCLLGQYVAAEPTATSDRVCLALNKTVLQNSCGASHFWYRGSCEPIPNNGCADGTADQTISPNMVGCRKNCNTGVNVRRGGNGNPSPPRWNRFWETACASGWHTCFGQEAVSHNDDCEGTWNANYAIFSYSVGSFWGECGSGQTTAYTTTVRGKSCSNDISRTALHPGAHAFFDGIYGGFVSGRSDFNGGAEIYVTGTGPGSGTVDWFAHRGWPHISLCRTVGFGTEGFMPRSKYPSGCSQNFCNTCAAGYANGPAQGTLCCRGGR